LIHEEKPGVPKYESMEFEAKHSDYCILIPVLNEHTRIEAELQRAMDHGIHQLCDVILCDGASTDGSADPETLRALGVNTLLVKRGPGKQGAQLRMGFSYALARGYAGFVTIDGNNKDSIEDVPRFLEKLAQGYDFVQGSRFVRGGRAVHTPLGRYLAVRLIHAPVISLTAGQCFTDTTNAYRAYSRRYLEHPDVQPLRDVFVSYELLAYLSVRASRLGLRACEVPVTRAYPEHEKAPTKIRSVRAHAELLHILWNNMRGTYIP
jgi:hypothetical protein